MLQATFPERQFPDLSPSSNDGFVVPKIDVDRCDIAQAFVVIVFDESPDLVSRIAGQVAVFQ